MTQADIKALADLLKRIEARPGFSALSAQVRSAILGGVAVVFLQSSSISDGTGEA